MRDARASARAAILAPELDPGRLLPAFSLPCEDVAPRTRFVSLLSGVVSRVAIAAAVAAGGRPLEEGKG
jgi:hypothetical protein